LLRNTKERNNSTSVALPDFRGTVVVVVVVVVVMANILFICTGKATVPVPTSKIVFPAFLSFSSYP
jgi:hypothetical protein